jgi:stage II sporulation protein M
LVLTPATYAILGYLLMQFLFAGYDISLVLGAVLTHGIVEIPMIVIAAAVGLRMGAIVTRPPRGETVGQAWTIAFADSLKLAIGVIIPGLLVAAFIESFITPEVVLILLGG